MIQSFINTTTPLASNTSSVVFQKDCIRTNSCCGYRSWLCHNEGSANYDIVNGGIYKINFNATVSSAATGAVAFALFNNGEQIPGTLMAETIDTAGDYANIGINKEVRVCCNGDIYYISKSCVNNTYCNCSNYTNHNTSSNYRKC